MKVVIVLIVVAVFSLAAPWTAKGIRYLWDSVPFVRKKWFYIFSVVMASVFMAVSLSLMFLKGYEVVFAIVYSMALAAMGISINLYQIRKMKAKIKKIREELDKRLMKAYPYMFN